MTRQEEKDFAIEVGKNIFNYLIKAGHGKMTIEEFNLAEKIVRPYLRSRGWRCYYRGPRIHNRCRGKPAMTMRCDAKYVVFG